MIVRGLERLDRERVWDRVQSDRFWVSGEPQTLPRDFKRVIRICYILTSEVEELWIWCRCCVSRCLVCGTCECGVSN